MKKQTIELNTFIWSGWQLDCPIEAIGEFFEHFPLDKSKERIKQMVLYCYKEDTYLKGKPNIAMVFYFAFSTLFRACYSIAHYTQNQHGIVIEILPNEQLELGTLTKDQYLNPLILIQEIFDYKQIDEWERAFLDLTYGAIVNRIADWEFLDLATICYLYQIIDAAWIIHQRALPILQQELNDDKDANTLQSSPSVIFPITNDTVNTISNTQFDIDPFSSAGWSGTAYTNPKLLRQDIFSNDPLTYFKSHINLLLESQLQSKPIANQNLEDVFRVYSRVNSLIEAAYHYQQHTQININTVIAVHSKHHWQMEWNYFVQHGLAGKKSDDPSELYALVYVVQTILDELHKIYLEETTS